MMNKFSAIVAILLAIFVTGCSGNNPENVVRSYLTAIDKGEITEAKQYVNPVVVHSFDAKVTSMVEAMAHDAQKHGGMVNLEVKADAKGEIGSYTYNIKYKDGAINKGSGKLKKVDGKWYLEP